MGIGEEEEAKPRRLGAGPVLIQLADWEAL